MAMEEGLEILIVAKKPRVDLLRRKCCRKGQVAAGDALGQGHDVGDNPFLFTGKHRTCLAKTYGYLVGNHDDVVPCAELPHPL